VDVPANSDEGRKKPLQLRVTVNHELCPFLYETLAGMRPKMRSEKVRHLAEVGLILEGRGIAMGATTAPASPFEAERNNAASIAGDFEGF